MLGIMLAAGKATRLPNKALLPVKDGIAIESGLRFLTRNCDDVVVVESPNMVISNVLDMRGWDFDSIIQAEPTGPQNAIQDVVDCLEYPRYLVAFCDNIYTENEFHNVDVGNYASVRECDNDELDGYEDGQWISRENNPGLKFGGWLCFESWGTGGHMGNSMLGCMNANGFQPVIRHEPWWDIGTIKSYKEYLRCVS